MAWRVAKSLETLLTQVNHQWPKRSTVSDGSIGDTRHSHLESDHNPNSHGVVCARDFTHDPQHGADMNELAAGLRRSKDHRIAYVIWNRRIMAGHQGPSPWVWRPYDGSNPHDHHLHLSVRQVPSVYDESRKWDVFDADPDPQHPIPEWWHRDIYIRPGHLMHGADVAAVQRRLAFKGKARDAIYGEHTEAAVRQFQRRRGLTSDGVVGRRTARALGK